MNLRRLPLVAIACFAILAVSGANSSRAQTVPAWPVAKQALLSIGVREGLAVYEFAGVSSVRRLASGQIVVANGNPRELRLFDAKGKFLRRIGRAGEGPGEFRGELQLVPTGGDSILVFDQGRFRRMLFGLDGKLMIEYPPANSGAILSASALTHRTFVRSSGQPLNGCVRTVLDALPTSGAPLLRDLFIDGAGRNWVRAFGGSQWMVYSANAKVLGSVQLPAEFELMQAESDFVVGIGRLADDVEQAVVLRVTQSPTETAHPACLNRTDTFSPPSTQRIAVMKMTFRQAAVANDAVRARLGHYVATLDSLGLEAPAGTTYRVLRVTENGWAAVLFDLQSTLVCVMAVGDATPPGWTDGLLRCGG